MLQLDTEVAELVFYPGKGSYWFVAACWEGKVGFFQEELVQGKGKSFVRVKQSKGSHTKDVISLDISEGNLLATASIDNVISFWNNYTA